MHPPILSILIPVYNADKYIKRCLDSIIQQKEFGLLVNLVIINDGSCDNSLSILKDYYNKYPQAIQLVTRENRGIGPTRNELIDLATGRYFWFVDADDYVEDQSLEMALRELQHDSYDMLIMSYNWVGTQGTRQILYAKDFSDGFEFASSGIYQNSLWARIIRKDVVFQNGIRFQAYVMGEDFDFLFKLLPHLKAIKSINVPMYNYVFNTNSAVGKSDKEHKKRVTEDSIKCIEKNKEMADSFQDEKKDALKIALNLFTIGFLYALYVDHFPINYKLNIVQRLEKCGAIPIKRDVISLKQKLFVTMMNHRLTRNFLLERHTVN